MNHRQRGPRRHTRLGLVLGGALLVVAAIAAVVEHRDALRRGDWARDTIQVLERSHVLLNHLADAETSQRSYVLTGDEAQLDAYRQATLHFGDTFQALRASSADHPRQQQRLAELERLGSAALGEFERAIAMRRSAGAQAALPAITSTYPGAMDGVRAALRDFQQTENKRLQIRLDQRAAASRWAEALIGAAILLGVALTTASVLSLERAARRHRVAERQAIESAERLAVTLRSIGDAVIATDPQGNVVFMNGVAEMLTGWPSADAHGRRLDDVFRIVNEDTRAVVESPVTKVLREGAIVGLANHTALIARDGSERPIADSGAPIRDAGDEIMGVVLVFRDVSEQRKADADRHRAVRAEAARESAEQALRERERADEATERLAALVQNSDDAIIGKTPDGTITSWNASAERMFGYRAEEVIGQHISLLRSPGSADEMGEILARIQRGERIEHYETERRRKDGTVLSVSLTVSPIRDRTGRIVGASKIARDISERRRAERELAARAEEARARLAELEATYAAAPLGLCLLDTDLRYVRINDRLAETNGLPPAEHIGRTVAEVVPDLADHAHEVARTIIATGEPVVGMEFTGTTRGDPGVQRTWVEHWYPLKYGDGRVRGISVIVEDVTDRKRAEAEREELLAETQRARAEAERANAMKDEFLAILSHELRSPLNAMMGWVTLLKRGAVTGDQVQRAVDTIERNLKLQAQLVNDLLDVSRIISGKLVLEMGAVPLGAVVQRCVENARPTAAAKGVELVSGVDHASRIVLGDDQRLEQVVTNLLTNAIKFTPPTGRVTVSLRDEGPDLCLEVADTGEGIAPDFLPHVFDRFRQGDGSSTRTYGGLGLGLNIVKSLVELHGGQVTAQSPGRGRGTTLRVRLPTQAHAGTITPRAVPHPDPQQSLCGVTVLLVEDDADARDGLSLALEASGATVLAAASGDDARRLLAERPVDVIVSDVCMPGESGYQLMRMIRERYAERIPAIAVTGFASTQDREAAVRAGFDEHVAKPVDPDALIGRVSMVVRRHRRSNEPSPS